jgi:mycofactocin precursor
MDENEVPQVVTMEDAPEVVEDELVEDVSIDGMCGVY